MKIINKLIKIDLSLNDCIHIFKVTKGSLFRMLFDEDIELYERKEYCLIPRRQISKILSDARAYEVLLMRHKINPIAENTDKLKRSAFATYEQCLKETERYTVNKGE